MIDIRINVEDAPVTLRIDGVAYNVDLGCWRIEGFRLTRDSDEQISAVVFAFLSAAMECRVAGRAKVRLLDLDADFRAAYRPQFTAVSIG
ncbi:MAG: hypothetical protein AMS18_00340 [Gemmatimonas sp. SG8_17]|nr:MAG: hypothetical protein AMS18_00340 [Gemmatimonas sp. SG8_17]